MILEFRFQDEFHLCSNVPDNLSALRYFLMGTFKADLPVDFKLLYTIPNQVENQPLQSEEDYQKLITQEVSDSIHITIVSPPKESEPEESKISDPVKVDEDKNAVDQPSKYPYFSYMSPQDEHIRKVVRETLQDQLPYVISQVKAALVKEFNLGAPQPKVERAPVQQIVRVESGDIEEVKNQANVREEVLDKEDGVIKPRSDSLVDKIGKTGIFDQVKKFGASIKDQVSELPGKTKGVFDNLSQKVAGDPYVDVEEGRYPESVVKKAVSLKEIFPEEERKNLLEFVKKYSRVVTLEQLANLYLMKDEPQPVEVVENNQRAQNQPADGIVEPL